MQRKNVRPVKIPTRLDLGQYLQRPAEGLAKYYLYAVIKHRGEVGAGHFIAWVKVGRQWWQFNDRTVTKASASEAVAQIYEQRDYSIMTPYMLFYERMPYADDGIVNPIERASALDRAQNPWASKRT